MPAKPNPAKQTVLGQPSWRITGTHAVADMTIAGGQIAPVRFRVGRRIVQPFSVAPWHDEKLPPAMPMIIRALRGDFFCMPFGGNQSPLGREKHPLHGETANRNWTLLSNQKGHLHARLDLRTRPGRVDKHLFTRRGEAALYSRHIISGMTGSMPIGHHAMLRFPDPPGSGVISTSPFIFGQVFPGQFENPEIGGYSFLKRGAEFDSLQRVPASDGSYSDLTRYPARRGYEDLVMISSDPNVPIAFSAVVFAKQRFVWFALKDPRVLACTIFWLSNGGRHYAPWSGRHVNVLGIEEVTANFHYGIAESVRPNAVSRRGIATAAKFDPRKPTTVNYIMAVAEVPRGFDRVRTIEPGNGKVVLVSESGKRIAAALDGKFLEQY